MKGTTAPRLQLELMCARVLLPAADDDSRSVLARLERLERRLAAGGMPAPTSASPHRPLHRPPRRRCTVRRAGRGPSPARPRAVAGESGARRGGPRGGRTPDADAAPHAATPTSASPDRPAPGAPAQPTARIGPAQEPAADPAREPRSTGRPTSSPPRPAGGVDVAAVRRLWPDVLTRLSELRRTSWTLVSQNAHVASLEGTRLVLAFSSAGLRDAFARGAHPELVRQALIDAVGIDCGVEAIVDPSATGGTAAGARHPAAPARGRSGSACWRAGPGRVRRSWRGCREQRPGLRRVFRPCAWFRSRSGYRPCTGFRPRTGFRPCAPARSRSALGTCDPPVGPAGSGGPGGQEASRRPAPPYVPPDQDEPSVDDDNLDDGEVSGAALVERDARGQGHRGVRQRVRCDTAAGGSPASQRADISLRSEVSH
jgi:DNA polymerase-3 subunit gamma/tau